VVIRKPRSFHPISGSSLRPSTFPVQKKTSQRNLSVVTAPICSGLTMGAAR
jgi:hypothetical protein